MELKTCEIAFLPPAGTNRRMSPQRAVHKRYRNTPPMRGDRHKVIKRSKNKQCHCPSSWTERGVVFRGVCGRPNFMAPIKINLASEDEIVTSKGRGSHARLPPGHLPAAGIYDATYPCPGYPHGAELEPASETAGITIDRQITESVELRQIRKLC